MGFLHRLGSMAEGGLHLYIMSDNVHDAFGSSGCCNWTAGQHSVEEEEEEIHYVHTASKGL